MTTDSGRDPARARLADLMDERRRQLRLTWDEVASRASIHRETLRNLRTGVSANLRPLTKAGLEGALKWKDGSVDAILAGGAPTPSGEPEPSDKFRAGIETANAVLDAMEEDPDLRRRLRKILSAASGQESEVNRSDTERDSGDDVAG